MRSIGKALRLAGVADLKVTELLAAGVSAAWTRPTPDGVPPTARALGALTRVVRAIPWDRLLDAPEIAEARDRMLRELNSLQRTLLPSLRFVQWQLANGGEFYLDDLRALLERTGVPLDIAGASLADLARRAMAALRSGTSPRADT